jgi:hypothetical protein
MSGVAVLGIIIQIIRFIGSIITFVARKVINFIYDYSYGIIKYLSSQITTSTVRATNSATTGIKTSSYFYKHKVDAALFAINRSWVAIPFMLSLAFIFVWLVLFGVAGLGRLVGQTFDKLDELTGLIEQSVLDSVGFTTSDKKPKKKRPVPVTIFFFILFPFGLIFILVLATFVMVLKCIARLIQGLYANAIPLSIIAIILILWTLGDYVISNSINTTSVIVDFGVDVINVGFGIANLLADIWDTFEPVIDAQIYASVQFISLTYSFITKEKHVPDCSIYRNPSQTLDRRQLELAQVMDVTDITEKAGKIFNFLAYIQVLLSDFDVLMYSILLELSESNVFQILIGAIIVIVGLVLCCLFGTFSKGFSTCGLQETANIIFSPFLPIQVLGVTIIPNVPVCSGPVLTALSVPCRCGGRAQVTQTPKGAAVNFGFFSELGKGDSCSSNPSNRRVLSCTQPDLHSWVEEIDEMSLHHSDSKDSSCSYIRKSLDPNLAAEIFEILKVEGDCLDACVTGVGYTVCQTVQGEHTVHVTGACGSNKKQHVGFTENGFSHAKRVLREYTNHTSNIRELVSRQEAIKIVQKEIPKKFLTDYGLECDLTKTSWSSIYEIAVDLTCLLVYEYRKKHSHDPDIVDHHSVGRKLLPESFEFIDNINRKLRIFNTIDANKTMDERMIRFTRRENTDFTYHSPYPLVMHRINEIVSRRTLSKVYTECGELYQCCDKSCVPFELRTTCPNTEGDLACIINQAVLNANTWLRNFNTASYLAGIRTCWDGYTCNPMTFPMNPVNLQTGNTIGVVYCVPFIGKVGGRLDMVHLNVMKDVIAPVCGPANDVSKSCSCPDYLPVYVTANWWGYLTVGIVNRFHNGILSLYTYLRMITFDPTIETSDIVCASRNIDNIAWIVFVSIFMLVMLLSLTPFFLYVINYYIRPIYFIASCGRRSDGSRLKAITQFINNRDDELKTRLFEDVTSLKKETAQNLVEANAETDRRLKEMQAKIAKQTDELRKELGLPTKGPENPGEVATRGLFKNYLDNV